MDPKIARITALAHKKHPKVNRIELAKFDDFLSENYNKFKAEGDNENIINERISRMLAQYLVEKNQPICREYIETIRCIFIGLAIKKYDQNICKAADTLRQYTCNNSSNTSNSRKRRLEDPVTDDLRSKVIDAQERKRKVAKRLCS